jgi:hypothetical protein
MGLLDELEQEAQRRKATLDQAERQKQERESVYKTQLDPAMQALYEFLAKLVDNLKFLKPRRPQVYKLASYGDVIGYLEHDYDLKISSQPLSKEITLTVTCTVATEECVALDVQGIAKVKATNAMFQKHRLAGIAESKKDDSGEISQATFRPRGKIPLSASIVADAESGMVRMTFNNFDGFGTLTRSVLASQFTEQLFDDLARYIAREPSNLFREDLPDDFRKQLQQKVQQEQLKRKWENKIAEQQREELERLKREGGKAKPNGAADPNAAGKPGGFLGKMRDIFKKG